MNDIYTVQKQIEKRLACIALEEAPQQARLILCHELNIDLLELTMQRRRELTPSELSRIEETVKRREKGEPLQYIFGTWEFFGLEFELNENVLIPRQDTETLVEKALTIAREIMAKKALDLCCGSGCVGVALAYYAKLSVDFADISPECINTAVRNAKRNGVAPNAAIESDLFSNVNGSYDIITINPPYLSSDDMKNLQREVTFEPELALYGGEDGLDFYRRIAREYEKHLNKGGALLMEFGAGQGSDVSAMFPNCELVRDLCGKERVAVVRG